MAGVEGTHDELVAAIDARMTELTNEWTAVLGEHVAAGKVTLTSELSARIGAYVTERQRLQSRKDAIGHLAQASSFFREGRKYGLITVQVPGEEKLILRWGYDPTPPSAQS